MAEDQWASLSTSEREQAINHYQHMEQLREQRRIEEEKLTLEKEKQRTLMMIARQEHADEIYSGDAGIRGDILRVTIRGGEVYMNGKHRQYKPISLRIADGEQKVVHFQNPKRTRYQTDMIIEYYHGVLSFDESLHSRNNYHYELVYEPEWRRGKHYQNITLNKHSHSRARSIEIIVDAIPLPHRQ